MPEWRVEKDNTTLVDDVYDLEIVETENPFGSYGIAYIDDFEGNKIEDFPIGTRLDFEVKPDGSGSYQDRLTTFVIERREVERRGADSLEVEAYDVNHLLRRGTVRTDVSGQLISEALQEIIETFTPVTWNASKVTLTDDTQVTTNYRTERTENVIQSLLLKSGNERFGVDSALEFFAEPRETSEAPRSIDNSQWLDYDLPDDASDKINQVEVFYDDGAKVVIVDDSKDKKDLQDSLGTSKPVAFVEQIMRDKITNQDAAIDAGNQRLNQLQEVEPYEISTYGMSTVSPGDIVPVRIVPAGIDSDFQVAATHQRWGKDTNTLTLTDNTGHDSDFNVRVSDTLKRVEMRIIGDEGDVTETRVIETDVGVLIDRAADLDGNSVRQIRCTNNLLNLLRDNYGEGNTINVAELKVGTDDTTPTRLDDSLGNAVETVAVSQSLPSSDQVQYTATFTTSEDIKEVGLFTSGGTLLVRGVWGTAQSADGAGEGDITLTLTVNNNDTTVEDSVATNGLQTLTRNIIADNSPSNPQNYLVGDDGTAPAESDTALGNQLDSNEIGNEIIQQANTTDEWTDVAQPADDTAIRVQNGSLNLLQSCFVSEAEDIARAGATTVPDGDASNGTVVNFTNSSGDLLSTSVSPEYDIPAGNVDLAIRNDAQDSYTITVEVDGVSQSTAFTGSAGLSWDTITLDDGLSAGDHTIRISGESFPSETGDVDLDVVAVRDNRFTYTDDNTVNGNGYLDGPELYPDQETLLFETAITQRDVSEATLSQTWDDTSGNQFIELANDGSTFTTANNSSSLTVTFANALKDVDTRVGMSRYGSTTGQTPLTGINGQSIDVHTLFGDSGGVYPIDVGTVEVKAPIPPNTLTGETLRESGQEAADSTLLTSNLFADVDVLADQQITNIETVEWQDPGEVLAEAIDDFAVDITSTNSPVDSGDTLTVDVTVENQGDAQGTQTIILRDFDGNEVDSQDVTLNSGASSDITLTWSTSSTLNEEGEITVESNDDDDKATVTVGSPQDENTTDDFEDGDIDEYAGCTSGSTVQQTVVCNGSYALQQDSNSDGSLCAIYSTGAGGYPAAGDTFRYCVRGASQDVIASMFFGVQSNSGDNAYRVDVDFSADDLAIYDIDGGSATLLDSATAGTAPINEWNEVEVTWSSDGSFTAELFDENDSSLATVSTTDTSYQSGGIGWGTRAAVGVSSTVTGYYDYLRILQPGQFIEDWEDTGPLSEWSNTGSTTIVNSPVSHGTKTARVPSGTDEVYSLVGQGLGSGNYPQQGDSFAWDVYLESGSLHRFYFGIQDSDANIPPIDDCYRVRVEDGGLVALDDISSGQSNTLDTQSVDPPINEYLTIYVDWTNPTITVVVEDSNGSEVARISADDTSYTSGGIAFGEGS